MTSVLRTDTEPILHRLVTSGVRAQTEPANGGFMRLVMRKHPDGDIIEEGVDLFGQPDKKLTQEQQDEEDEKARKRAMKNLVNSWQERLQLISVITTFFASVEAGMLVNTKPASDTELNNNILKASNATLLGALIMHVYAAVLSFLAAFLLIRYKLKEATREELIAEGIKMVGSPLTGSIRVKDVECNLQDPEALQAIDDAQPMSPAFRKPAAPRPQSQSQMRMGSLPAEPPIISKNPHLEQVGPFMSNISSHLLSRFHTLCILLAAAGFVLAILGIIFYAWAIQPLAVSVFATACLGIAILSMVTLLI